MGTAVKQFELNIANADQAARYLALKPFRYTATSYNCYAAQTVVVGNGWSHLRHCAKFRADRQQQMVLQ